MRRAVPILLLALLWFAAPAHAANDPAKEWFTLITDHFAIHSYDGGEKMARRAASFAEQAYAELNELLGWTPEERTHITVVDDVDAANGFAMVSPFNWITLLSYPPSADGSLSDYDDWLRLLVYHEYTHIVHLDNATGLPRIINTVMGKTVKPNEALPRWFSEGVATWIETHTSGAGRVDNSRFDMYLRTAALADRLLELHELTGVPLQLPGASSWYLYGGYLIDYIVRHTGPEAIRDYAHAYGRRIIPYSMNIIARQTTGKDLRTWHKEMLDEQRAKAQATKKRLTEQGLVEGKRLTTEGWSHAHPRFTPDGRQLAFTHSDGHSAGFLMLGPAGDPASAEPITQCYGGCGRYDLSRDGTEVTMATGRPYRRISYYTDLWRFPARHGQQRRAGRMLTEGRRNTDPFLQGDGRAIWVVRASWGETWLESLHPISGDTLYRWDPPEFARLSTPVATPDGRTVFFAMHHRANSDLYELDTRTGRHTRLSHGEALEIDLNVTPDGHWLLYSSDATGIYNIYARHVTRGRTHRITNVLSGAFQPEVSPDGKTLVYVGWTVDGTELYSLPFDPESAPPVAIPDPRPARRQPPSPPELRFTRQRYTPLPTMLPRSWMPTYTADTTGLSRIGLALGGLDVTERLSTAMLIDYDIAREDFSAAVALNIGLSWPDISISAGRYSADRYTYFDDRVADYREEVYYAAADVGIGVPSVIEGLSLNLGFTVDIARALEAEPTVHAPDQYTHYVPREGLSTQLRLGFGWSDVERYGWGISPGKGGSGRVDFSLRHPALGADRTAFAIRYDLRRYITMPWLEDHVLALRLRGGWSGGKRGEFGGFGLGGVPEQNYLVDIINQSQAGASWLRGFEPGAFYGDSFHMLTVEYRFPILRGRAGLDTLPLYVRDLHAALFSDLAVTYIGPFDESTFDLFRGSIGLELRVDVELFLGLVANFRLGYAHGFGPEGIDHVYLLMAPAP